MIDTRLKAKLRDTWMIVFLDGRNEHGCHVLPMDAHNTGDSAGIEPLLPDYAENIICEAEAVGHEVADCVVTLWNYVPSHSEEPGYWEYREIDTDLTEIFCGTPSEQRAFRMAAEL